MDSAAIPDFELVAFCSQGFFFLLWARRLTKLIIFYCEFPQRLHDANTWTVREN